MTDEQAPVTTTPAPVATEPSQSQTPAPASPPDATAVTPPVSEAAKDTAKAVDPAQLLFEEPPQEGEDGAVKEGEGEKTEADKADDAAEPIKIEELTVPEDMPIPEEMKGPMSEYITENKLDKAGAQKLTDLGVKMQQHNLDIWTKTKTDWRKEVEADPELGGQNLKQTVAKANDVIRQFAGTEENLAELKQDLVLLGLGNKRSFVRFLTNISKATGNDSAAGASGTGSDVSGQEAMAKRMYPNMK